MINDNVNGDNEANVPNNNGNVNKVDSVVVKKTKFLHRMLFEKEQNEMNNDNDIKFILNKDNVYGNRTGFEDVPRKIENMLLIKEI